VVQVVTGDNLTAVRRYANSSLTILDYAYCMRDVRLLSALSGTAPLVLMWRGSQYIGCGIGRRIRPECFCDR